ncbi:patatin-like phospholipase family protein [Oceanibacterium hippocampi]|uniref:Patatin-like phospholipase n=1 Tax=Oceanibacterium hippocampi TaxID=745714 RepID=A0A1Y5S1Y5_9PROT|nr:patatin-like phospholipase family protein [Oceanibacterium hippocampi]SLN30700.1 Patatin-like phospholipase [Oceanibacterium hippocampi]
MAKSDKAKRTLKPLNLALQGGGAHGAFAWGVIDRLLEENCFDIKGIVGTSAGAMNATVTASGLATGGAEGGRRALHDFWKKISDAARYSPLQASPWEKMFGTPGNLDSSPMFMAFEAMSRILSPYQLNPTNYNPLRDVLDEVIDCDALHVCRNLKLFICASNVKTGKIRVFDEHDVTIDAVLASACLPFMFQAVEIDGEAYWDGGYMGNPPLYPLFYHTDCRDVLIIQLNPIAIPEVPKTAQAILDRVNTLSFNSSLMRELRVIDFVTKLIDDGYDGGGRLRKVLIHTVDAEDVLGKLGASSKLNADWDFLMSLKETGRQRGEAFLNDHYDKVGVASSTDIAAKFL